MLNDLLPFPIDNENPNPLSSIWFELDCHHKGEVYLSDLVTYLEEEAGISIDESRKKFLNDCFNARREVSVITHTEFLAVMD